MKSDVGVFVQCRLDSKRLPAKALLSLGGVTLLGRVIYRAKQSGFPVYILTSNSEFDDLVELEANKIGCAGVFRGSLNDVRSRFVLAAEQTNVQTIVRLTADNPLVDPRIIRLCVHAMTSGDCGYDYVRARPDSCPDGTNCEVFSKESLLRALDSNSESDIEHVTPAIIENAKENRRFEELPLKDLYPYRAAQYHLGIDTIGDYRKVARVFEDFCCSSLNFNTELMKKIISRDYDYPEGRRHGI